MASFARSFSSAFARGFASVLGRGGGEILGPNLAPTANGGGWTLNLNGGLAGTVTQDGSGIHFVGANNIASVSKTAGGLVLKDNATYEVVFTVANFASANGGVRVLLGGNTLNHGASGTTRTANGTYTERLTLTGTFSSTNIIRIQVTGTNGNNTLDVTFIEVREVIQQ